MLFDLDVFGSDYEFRVQGFETYPRKHLLHWRVHVSLCVLRAHMWVYIPRVELEKKASKRERERERERE